jgi:hypothetical protein
MLSAKLLTGAAAVTVAMSGSMVAPPAGASLEDVPINGTFLATSNGDWAKTNEVYHDEVTVRAVWTITSTCSDRWDCTGSVTSDRGWTAPLRRTADSWEVERDLPNWEPCADGTGATGHQKYRFWHVAEDGRVDLSDTSRIFAGEDRTIGPSGACGINRWLVIRMPFRLEKLD